MYKQLFKTVTLSMIATLAYASGVAANRSSVSLTQSPVVMRLSGDEFRIAFGINAEHCVTNGCMGVIRYRVDWRTDDGTARSELKQVDYRVIAHAKRTIAVDRARFDTAEGEHTTAIVKVRVEKITCLGGDSTDL